MISIQLPKPHSGQLEIYKDPARFKIAACGRRWGKTELSKIMICKELLINKGKVAYISGTYKQLNEVWRQLCKTLNDIIVYKSEQLKTLELSNGATLSCWSQDAIENIRGWAFTFIVVDEAALIKNLQAMWDGVLRPTLFDYIGKAFFISSPRGLNYFKTLFDFGQINSGDLKEFKSWRFPTTSNPFMPKQEIEVARATTSQRFFKQEYLAEFTDTDGEVFRGVDRVAILNFKDPYPSRFIGGLDFGRSYDYTVFSVIDANTNELVFYDKFSSISWTEQRERIVELYNAWNLDIFVVEENSFGDVNIEELEKEGVYIERFFTSRTTKKPLIDALAVAIENQELMLLLDQDLLSEFGAYQMTTTPAGNFKFGAASGFHDDIVMSVALAWHGVILGDTVFGGAFRKIA